MPKIKWEKLPRQLYKHLALRAAERKVSTEDLIRLDQWKQSGPVAPAGKWWKDFGTFKLAGEDEFARTFLEPGQAVEGEEID